MDTKLMEKNVSIVNRLDKDMVTKLFYSFAVVLRYGLGCMFIWSALPKLRQPYVFLTSIYEYELVGPKLGMLAGMLIPWLELFIGICLIGGIFIGGALLATTMLMAFFTFAHATVIYRDLQISCGCFSSSDPEVISYSSLIRNCLLLLACIIAFLGFFSESLLRTSKR